MSALRVTASLRVHSRALYGQRFVVSISYSIFNLQCENLKQQLYGNDLATNPLLMVMNESVIPWQGYPRSDTRLGPNLCKVLLQRRHDELATGDTPFESFGDLLTIASFEIVLVGPVLDLTPGELDDLAFFSEGDERQFSSFKVFHKSMQSTNDPLASLHETETGSC